MNNNRIGITGMGAISALGYEVEEVWKNYCSEKTAIGQNDRGDFVAALSAKEEERLAALRRESKYYGKLDRSVLLAILAARQASRQAGWEKGSHYGINLSSSRGATTTFEHFHTDFLQSGKQSTAPLSSPLTTLGNLASWVASDLETTGPAFSHSITCSSAAHGLLNSLAWLHSGMADRFLFGGTEAPLTAFTIAQMKALKIYQNDRKALPYPCRSLDENKPGNTMVLGEGAACFCLENNPLNALAYIESVGYARESVAHPTQISTEGSALQTSMSQALEGIDPASIDAILLHAPGTVQGDRSEQNAISQIFTQKIPKLTTNKWKIGHTLGASAALSMQMAILMLQKNIFLGLPYLEKEYLRETPINKVLINAIGFGGNAVSLVIGSGNKKNE